MSSAAAAFQGEGAKTGKSFSELYNLEKEVSFKLSTKNVKRGVHMLYIIFTSREWVL